jgi:hypothetical protein
MQTFILSPQIANPRFLMLNPQFFNFYDWLIFKSAKSLVFSSANRNSSKTGDEIPVCKSLVPCRPFHGRNDKIAKIWPLVCLFGEFFWYKFGSEHLKPIFKERKVMFFQICAKNRIRNLQIRKLPKLRKVFKSNKFASLLICDLRNLFVDLWYLLFIHVGYI